MKRTKAMFFLAALLIPSFLLNACSLAKNKNTQPRKSGFDVFHVTAIQNKRGIHQEWITDTSQRTIPLTELTVLLRRNAIRPLNNPRYISNQEATGVLFGGQPVIAVKVAGQWLGFPLNILSYHEIVNDSLGNIHFTVAYCPLCNTAYVFNRNLTFKGKNYLLKFGTTGMLRKSNLVMWDEQTETWWQHLTAKGIVGTLAGASLEIFPAKIISLNNFWHLFPNGKTLWPATDPGEQKQYGINPYVKYDSLGVQKPFLFFGTVDPRLPAMEYVIGIENGNNHKAYPLSTLETLKVINDKMGNENIVLFYNDDMVSNLDTREIKEGKHIGSGTVYKAAVDDRKLTFTATENGFKDQETGSIWNFAGQCTAGPLKGKTLTPVVYSLDFAFAYLAFYPQAVVFKH